MEIFYIKEENETEVKEVLLKHYSTNKQFIKENKRKCLIIEGHSLKFI